MVSLVNFKQVDMELMEVSTTGDENLGPSSSSIVMQIDEGSISKKQDCQSIKSIKLEDEINLEQITIQDSDKQHHQQQAVLQSNFKQQQQFQQQDTSADQKSTMYNNMILASGNSGKTKDKLAETSLYDQDDRDNPCRLSPDNNSSCDKNADANFTVTWRNLTFGIKQKFFDKLFAQQQQHSHSVEDSRQIDTIENVNSKQDKKSSSKSKTADTPVAEIQSNHKIVLDNLDGCFKSGQLTAILGPSGEYTYAPGFHSYKLVVVVVVCF